MPKYPVATLATGVTPRRLAAGEFHLLGGPAKLRILSGAVEAVGARLGKGRVLDVPYGKRVPFRTLEAATVSLAGDAAASTVSGSAACPRSVAEGAAAMTPLAGNSIPADWDRLARRILAERKAGALHVVVVLGEVDTGKTFFSTYLANRLLGRGKRTAVLDCDTGQSDIGPPGTFGLLLLRRPTVFLAEEPPTHLAMTGAHSPNLHFLPTVTALNAMLRKARAEADVLIVDTTGWVQGDGGRALKKAKLDLLDPRTVVLLQRGTELEHLVKHLPPARVVRLPVSKKASPTSQMERRSLREHVSTRYFRGARVFEMPFASVFTDRAYFLTGAPLELEGALHAERLSAWEGVFVVARGPLAPETTRRWPEGLGRIVPFTAGDEAGLMTALLDKDQECLALARLEKLDFEKKCFRLRSPYAGRLDRVRGIQFGSLKLTEDGREAGFLEPGSL